jgi:hypothetical protein
MKTQIIQLEQHDDAVSTREKMAWGSSERILLVFPERGRILTRRVDLALLQRHSQALGAQMAMVTAIREVRQNAHDLGIPVFKSVIRAQKGTWRSSSEQWPKFKPRPALRLVSDDFRKPRTTPARELSAYERLIVFGLGVLAVLALGLFLLPGATISLAPVAQMQQIRLEIWADPAVLSPSFTGSIPAAKISVEVEGAQTVPSSGHTLTPVQAATGEVTFTNLSDRDVIVPAGTIVRTQDDPPVRFETQIAIALAGTGQVQVTTPVRALDAGAVGNVAAGEIVAIEGSAGPFLLVTNQEKMSGGADQFIPAPGQDDHADARQQLLDALTRQAESEMKAQLPAETFLLTPTLSMQAIKLEDRQPGEGQPGEQLTVKISASFRAWYIYADDIRSAATLALDANMLEGHRALPDTLRIVLEGQPITRGDSAGFRIRAERQVMVNWSPDEVAHLARGKSLTAAARAIQESLGLIEAPKIDIWPQWWPRLPDIPFRIHVQAP